MVILDWTGSDLYWLLRFFSSKGWKVKHLGMILFLLHNKQPCFVSPHCCILIPLDPQINPQPWLPQKRFYFLPVAWSKTYLHINRELLALPCKKLLVNAVRKPLFQFVCLNAIKCCKTCHNKLLNCHCHLLKETPQVIGGTVHFLLADKGSVLLSSVSGCQAVLGCARTSERAQRALRWHFDLFWCLALLLQGCIYIFSFPKNYFRL